jgi:DNA-binding CsgD family transcriptional regulator
VVDGTYWGAAGFPRNKDDPWYAEDDGRVLTSLCEPIAEGFRRALLIASVTAADNDDDGPGVVVFDEHGRAESISPAAERWIDQLIEIPRPGVPSESKVVHVVAARARSLRDGQDPLELAARSRVRTSSGTWLLLYGTQLSGGADGRTAVIIQPAAPNDVAPLVALAYGLSDRECQVTRLCMHGRSTKEIALTLQVSPNTVQDHFKSIFDKTDVRSRGELVGQIFLEHYVPRWEDHSDCPSGWTARLAPWQRLGVFDLNGLERVRVQSEQGQDARCDLGGLYLCLADRVMAHTRAGHDRRDIAILRRGATVSGDLLDVAGVDDAVLGDADEVRCMAVMILRPDQRVCIVARVDLGQAGRRHGR